MHKLFLVHRIVVAEAVEYLVFDTFPELIGLLLFHKGFLFSADKQRFTLLCEGIFFAHLDEVSP